MELKAIHLGDDYTHLALCGKLDNMGVTEIQDQFLDYTVKRALSSVVDISDMTFTGSNGLRLFLLAVKGLRPAHKVVILLNPKPFLKEVLLDSGIQEALIIEQDTESALAKARA